MHGDKWQFFSDQTGILPKMSNKGAKCIMAVYNQGANTMLAEALSPRSEHELLQAMTKIHKYLK